MTTPTPRVDIPSGTLLTVPSGDWKYGAGTLRMRVNRVMHEISRFEPGWV